LTPSARQRLRATILHPPPLDSLLAPSNRAQPLTLLGLAICVVGVLAALVAMAIGGAL
jgi:hypothetical protein